MDEGYLPVGDIVDHVEDSLLSSLHYLAAKFHYAESVREERNSGGTASEGISACAHVLVVCETC